ncbi:putative transmembrane protein [Rhodopirellula islandica]|uniref:Transmembrane protein n=1 Tax=Rhodopirellula islandica TaxID=595434 RepID=A0A0J1BDN6_RHOIS|nr:hypothetical protein [Rhodopirellula islandica]KLU04733.1 putative transmembrane protein [Rhodopirellula islandica]
MSHHPVSPVTTSSPVKTPPASHALAPGSGGGGPACDAFESRLNQWIDADAEADIDNDGHLIDCQHCRQTLAIWRHLEVGSQDLGGNLSAATARVSFRRLAVRWSVAVAACFLAVIVLRAPGTHLSVDQANSGVGTTGDGLQWKGASPVPSHSEWLAKGTVANALSGEAFGLQDEVLSPKGALLVSGEAAVDSTSSQSLLLAQWIAQSRPTVAQLSVGVAPLGRTLQRTANLFY